MSTWISRAALPALALSIAGCGAGIPVTRNAPEAVLVANQSVVVAGPPGYCIDESVSDNRTEGAFVLLGSCASIAGNAALPHPERPGVLTVTVSEGPVSTATGAPRPDDLVAYFRTDAGRAALSRDGHPDSVEIIETRVDGNALYLHARDPGGRRKGMADDYWRALLNVNERLVILSVNSSSARPLAEREGQRTLDAFAARIRAANAVARRS